MVASLLSVVTILGEEMIFPFPDASRAESERSRRRLSRRIPKAIPPPAPDPIAAGRLTAKVGVGAVGENGGVFVALIDPPGMGAPDVSCAPVSPYWVFPL